MSILTFLMNLLACNRTTGLSAVKNAHRQSRAGRPRSRFSHAAASPRWPAEAVAAFFLSADQRRY